MLTVRGPRYLVILLVLAACPVVAGDAPRLPWVPTAWRTAWSMPDQLEDPFPPGSPRYGVSGEGLAVATPQGAVAVRDPRTGSRRYTIPAGTVPTAGVWVAAGTIVVARQAGAADRQLSGYELADGTLLWRRTVTVERVEVVEGAPGYSGPTIMVTGRGVTYINRQGGPYTFTSLDLRTGRITARTVRPRGCGLVAAASARSVALLSDCAGRVELASVNPYTLHPDWTRSLRTLGQAAGPVGLKAGDDGYLDVRDGGGESFFAPDGRLVATAPAALEPPPAAGAARPEQWSRPFGVGAYPELTRERDLLTDSRGATPNFLISLDTVTGRVRALPIALPALNPILVGTTEDMAFVHDQAGRIFAYTLVHGLSGAPAPPGGAPLSDWPDACALLGERAASVLGGYRPGPGRRTVAGVPTPKPADCDWIPPTDEGAVVSVSVAWVFSTPAVAREVFAAMVRHVKQTGRYDPTTETPYALSQTLPRTPSGMMSESIVTVGPALILLRSSSRRAIRLLTPPLQRNLLARYEPGAVVPDGGPRAARPAGWSFPADDGFRHLMVADGIVYAGSDDGKVYALDAVSGALRWSHQFGDLVTQGPIRAGGTVYAATYGRIVALDAVRGRTRWSRRTIGTGGLTVDGRTVYVATERGLVIALDTASGRTRWRAGTGDLLRDVIPHAAGHLVYAVGRNGVVALDAGSGERRWRFRVDGRAGVAGVATTADTVYVATQENGRLHALDQITGRPKWRFRTGVPLYSGPQVSGGAVYVGDWGVLHKLDAATGARQWTFKAGGSVAQSAFTVVRGDVYVTIVGDRLHDLDAATGETRWSFPLGGEDKFGFSDVSRPVLVGDALYAAAGNGRLDALDAATGTRRWSFQTGGDLSTAPVVAGGRVYAGGMNGNVYAIRASDGRVDG
ncbi:outer membrane protein assembly factor BamB family protein [Nonomuraea helvata]|uniref:PQQ-binding-like beta-propeller repeat protein n=1 Tax=Nonomuraea helvata TaxID=37484 RepID=A0ABV5RWT8_9ACTN